MRSVEGGSCGSEARKVRKVIRYAVYDYRSSRRTFELIWQFRLPLGPRTQKTDLRCREGTKPVPTKWLKLDGSCRGDTTHGGEPISRKSLPGTSYKLRFGWSKSRSSKWSIFYIGLIFFDTMRGFQRSSQRMGPPSQNLSTVVIQDHQN